MTIRKTEFLNVDLVLRHAGGLRKLLRALRSGTVVLHAEEKFAIVQSKEHPKTIEAAIAGLLEPIDALTKAARAIWDGCGVRQFDIGIQAGEKPNSTEFKVSCESIERIRSVGGEVVITIYGSGLPEVAAQSPRRVIR